MINLMRVGQGSKLHIQWKENWGVTRCGIGMTLHVKQPRTIVNMPNFSDAQEAAQFLQTNYNTEVCKSCLSNTDEKDGE